MLKSNFKKQWQLTNGVYQIEDGLSLDIDNVTITGSGHKNTVLDFSNQMTGAQGLMITSDGITLKDFAIINTKGDAIKAKGSNGISFLSVGWVLILSTTFIPEITSPNAV